MGGLSMAPSNLHLLGQIALKEGLVTRDQLAECVGLQGDGRTRSLGTILVEKGYLTPAKLAEIESIAAIPSRGGLFGQLAVRHGYISSTQLSECLREQETLSQGGSALRLGQLLIRKQYLSSAQFLEILRFQHKEAVNCPSCGTLLDARAVGGGATASCSRCGTAINAPRVSAQTTIE